MPRDRRMREGSSIAATKASAVNCPTPGIVISLRQAAEALVKGAIRWTRLSCRSFAANAVRLQLHALAYNLGNFLRTPGDARADQRLVADEPQGKADQDRREDRQPWSLCRFPDGRSRHSENSLCRRPAADRGVAAATRYIDSVMRSVWRSTKNHGRRAS